MSPDWLSRSPDLLQAEGFEVEFRHERGSRSESSLVDPFDAIILDVMLPKQDGYQVCRELRERGVDAGILMLTAKTQVVDRVTGLRLRRR